MRSAVSFPRLQITPAPAARRYQHESGYLLLAALLMMALMIIAATIEAPRLVQQIKRDREEEMIHRGTQYMRAIQKFYKKFGRYPATLEQLDNTNQIRFLRQHYKDPLAKDGKWKILSYGDIQTLLNPNAPGTPAAALGTQGQGAVGQPSAVSSLSSTGTPSTFGAANVISTSSTGFDQGTLPVQQQQQQQTGFAGSPTQGNAQQGSSPFANTFSLGSNTSNSGQQGSAAGSQPGGASSSPFGTAGGNQTFGGGAIVGVASVNKDPTIRIYNKKKTYDEWVFIYNPVMDTRPGVLLRGPYQPTVIGGAQVGTPAGQLNQSGQGALGQQQTGFGQPSNGPGQQYSPQQNSPVNQFPPDQNTPH